MRIAYIAPYQGADLLQKRPLSEYSLSLAARVKIQLIAELLQKSSHQVDIISQGAVNVNDFRYYPGFVENELFHPNIPVHYASALPVRFLRGFWEGSSARRLLKARHDSNPYDAVIIYSLGSAQLKCAQYAMRSGLPVILEYEDDAFSDVQGNSGRSGIDKKQNTKFIRNYHLRVFRKFFENISGVMAASPYLLSQVPDNVQKILLRGVVSNEILKLRHDKKAPKKNWVVFSGTHERTQGVAQTIQAWRKLQLHDWELHIAGQGVFTNELQALAAGDRSIIFHGYLNREQNAELLCAAQIGMNAQDPTRIPGNVFAFKIVEYLAAGLHVVTTSRGALEPELEPGVSYLADNSPEAIATCLKQLIETKRYAQNAEKATVQLYGPASVGESLNNLLMHATKAKTVELQLA